MNKEQYTYLDDIRILFQYHFGIGDDIAWWIASQFALESNYGNSPLARAYNNHCGMRVVMVRPSTQLNQCDAQCQFGHYNSLLDCIIDYWLCITFHKPLRNELENLDMYRRFVKSFYCSENDYIDKINLIYSQLKTYKNG